MNDTPEDGDLDEALSAALAVVEYAIQSKIQGNIVPESFTHGIPEQRKYCFMKGYKTSDTKQGNTFSKIRQETKLNYQKLG
jgi:predicted metalloprotease